MRGDSYTPLERWLHWLALEPRFVRQLAFDLECRWSLPKGAGVVEGERPVYVCGLARSGTTILLRALARVEDFRSLTYRDMPFVLAPNLWARVTTLARRTIPQVERAHGDGILVDYDSPEAFEEVFWRTFCPQPPGARGYGEAQPQAEAMAAFAKYRAVVANPRRARAGAAARRYLSKNNNNLVRLGALASDATARIFVVYREPIACARSLFRQHRRFVARQSQDPFTRAYMGWLGHHEFGLDHIPFGFALPEMDRSLTPDQPAYWIDYWTAVHRHLARELPGTVHLVDHDRLREAPEAMLRAVADAAGIRADPAALAVEIRQDSRAENPPSEFDAKRLERAREAHHAMKASANNVHR